MIAQALKKYDALLGKALLLLTFLWPLFVLGRGVDELDSAYYLANFKFFFDPILQPTIATELTFLFGGILYQLNPFPDFIAFRVLDWLVNCAVWYTLYRMLCRHMPKLWLSAGILVGSLLVRRYPMMLSYNSFSFLFFLMGLYLMQQALLEKSPWKITWSGLLIGFNVFFRIPNALQAFMVLLPFAYTAADKEFSFGKAWQYALRFTLAGFIGLFVGAGLTILLEGWSTFVDGIAILFRISGSGSHAPDSMFQKIQFQLTEAYYYFGALKPYIALLIALPMVYTLLRRRIHQPYMVLLLQLLCGAMCLFLGHRLGNNLFMALFVYSLSLLALCSTLIAVLGLAKINRALYLHACMMLLFILTVPVGTDNGVFQFCLLASVLLSAILSYLSIGENGVESAGFFQHLMRSYARIVAIVVVAMFMIGAVFNVIVKESYRDGTLASQNTRVNVPALAGMYTNAEKAEALESYYRLASNPALADREIAVSGAFPMAHILTDHRPFFGHVWTDLKTVDKQQIFAKLQAADTLPIIVLGRFDPNLYHTDFYDAVQAFAESHPYTKTEHTHFTFYAPNE